MPRTPYVDKNGLRKGPWSKEEDDKLRAYIERYGHWNWREIPRFAGVSRCGKSCRLRWMNYLRPNIKHGNFTKEEEDLIMELHKKIGNKWATIATELPGRSDNEIKNYWHTHLKKRANKDQNVLKNVNCETKNVYGETLESSHLGDLDEVEALWASLSTESLSPSSYSSSVELTSSMFMASDCLVSSGDSLQRYNNEYDGNFWTEPFFADYDGMRSTAYSSSDSDVVNNVMAPDSCHDMTMNDEFVWSTMDLYSEYHGQFM